jgi:hypothetical protein
MTKFKRSNAAQINFCYDNLNFVRQLIEGNENSSQREHLTVKSVNNEQCFALDANRIIEGARDETSVTSELITRTARGAKIGTEYLMYNRSRR